MSRHEIAASPTAATAIGVSAIAMWGALALLSTFCTRIPPFELIGLCFGLAFLLTLAYQGARRENPMHLLKVMPLTAWLVGVGGLFGFHFCYFMALKLAPAIHASLLASLWPVLLLLLNPLINRERLWWWQLAGTLVGFGGALVLVTGGRGIAIDWGYGPGYLFALGCAITWAAYSVLSRRFDAIPTVSVGWFCGLTALLAWACHALMETWTLPTATEGLAVAGLGLGPIGLAFFTWDYGLKHGDIRLLGTLAYLGPLISALLLVSFGKAAPGWPVTIACLLILGGAYLGSGQWRKAATPMAETT